MIKKRNKKILVCDNDQSILEVLELILQDAGFTVITEQSSMQVYRAALEKKPDLLLLDLYMPVLSGEQVLQMLKSNAATAGLPVILCSASSAAAIAAKAGASDFVEKPFDVQELLSKIHAQLAQTSCF